MSEFKWTGTSDTRGILQPKFTFKVRAASLIPPAPERRAPILDPPGITCDRLLYIGSRGGCHHPGFIPVLKLSLSGDYPKSARHILDSQRNIAAHPGNRALGGKPLTRRYWGDDANLNRREALKKCRRLTTRGSCDEYPFAGSRQGCYYRPTWCRVARIPLADNVGSGRKFGTFLQENRIADGKPFWVKIVR